MRCQLVRCACCDMLRAVRVFFYVASSPSSVLYLLIMDFNIFDIASRING